MQERSQEDARNFEIKNLNDRHSIRGKEVALQVFNPSIKEIDQAGDRPNQDHGSPH